MTSVRIVDPDDATLAAWLVSAGLEVPEPASDPVRIFSLTDLAGRVVAFGGLEGSGTDILLRSVVVDPGLRGRGIGTRMIRALGLTAADAGARRLWLLTTDAAPVFAALGWRVVDRADVAPAIAKTRQFLDRCPASAILMCKTV